MSSSVWAIRESRDHVAREVTHLIQQLGDRVPTNNVAQKGSSPARSNAATFSQTASGVPTRFASR